MAGTTALIGPGSVDEFQLTVVATTAMVAVALPAWAFLAWGGQLRRWEGIMLVGTYALTLPFSA